MNKTNTGFLEASPGNKSVMRLAFLILVLFDCFMCGWIIIVHKDYTGALIVFTPIMTFATGLKLVQKTQEKNGDTK